MIEFVEGVLTAKSPSHAVIQVGGIGLRGIISLSTYDDLPAIGQPFRLWTHLQVRDDELVLFAFSALEERWLFRHLITVNGVGPRLAMTVLSAARSETIRRAVADGDSDRLKSIPRIGAKIAERIVLELKKKLGEELPETAAMPGAVGSGVREAVDALCALGFTRNEAEKAVAGAAKRGAQGVEELVKQSLRMD
ncbi:Holliday junction branch migration protein RuvA [bacterium]|nr:Holliday junction branch migration protein RuvA [bacterium]MBU1984474.1 Holliday junction branch migration protein RuvA [bacterium]